MESHVEARTGEVFIKNVIGGIPWIFEELKTARLGNRIPDDNMMIGLRPLFIDESEFPVYQEIINRTAKPVRTMMSKL